MLVIVSHQGLTCIREFIDSKQMAVSGLDASRLHMRTATDDHSPAAMTTVYDRPGSSHALAGPRASVRNTGFSDALNAG